MLRLFSTTNCLPSSNNNVVLPQKGFKAVKTHLYVTTKHHTQLVRDDNTFMPIMNASSTHSKFV
jgi:hypothetical protein